MKLSLLQRNGIVSLRDWHSNSINPGSIHESILDSHCTHKALLQTSREIWDTKSAKAVQNYEIKRTSVGNLK